MKKLIICALFISSGLFAQNEFFINSFQDTTQRDPHIRMSENGEYIIVWDSENQVSVNSRSDIYLQKFDASDNKIGNETLINDLTDGEQEKPALGFYSMDRFVIAWSSFIDNEKIYDIHARFSFNSSLGNEITVNTETLNSQTCPAADINAEGAVIVWESWYQDGGDRGIYAQRFDNAGEKVGGEFLVNSTTAYSQARPVIKFLNNGKFIIIWESWKQDIATPSGYGIFAKIFNSDGTVYKNEFQINSYTNDFQWFGDIAPLQNGGFAAAWCSWQQDGYDGGIYLNKFDADGNREGDELQVNRTTVYYQWLPKIKVNTNGNIGVIWSSWKTDGSREGVYFSLFDSELNKMSFETLLNDYTDSYQWEPDFDFNQMSGENEIVAVWSSWGQFGKENDYDIIAKRFIPYQEQGSIITSSYEHPAGNSTSRIIVHVIDSTALSGDTYKIEFNMAKEDQGFAKITNENSSSVVINEFPLLSGEGVFYLTDPFDGVAVEIIPNFTLALDLEKSYFQNTSGTNITFAVSKPTSGAAVIAPVDFKLTWANTDTTNDGSYANVQAMGYGITGVKEIELPFKPLNITDDDEAEVFIIENSSTSNKRWDPGEQITIMTPAKYQTSFPNFHAQINVSLPQSEIIMPGEGDVNFIYTKKPLTSDDVFKFTADKNNFTTDIKDLVNQPNKFELSQNYPNPFNPSTTIKYSIPDEGMVSLRIFNILGEQVGELVNEIKKPGNYKVLFNASSAGGGLASGVYIYSIQMKQQVIAKKMILLK